jgi:hypothetical protein
VGSWLGDLPPLNALDGAVTRPSPRPVFGLKNAIRQGPVGGGGGKGKGKRGKEQEGGKEEQE